MYFKQGIRLVRSSRRRGAPAAGGSIEPGARGPKDLRHRKMAKTFDTCDSHVVPHRSTEQAQWCLTSEFGWDPVLSPWYDRMMGDDRWGPTPIATHPPPMPKRSTSSGDRTHDHKIKSLALYHLSYGGPPCDRLSTTDGRVRIPVCGTGHPGSIPGAKKGIEPELTQ